jgi:hypothetical protein
MRNYQLVRGDTVAAGPATQRPRRAARSSTETATEGNSKAAAPPRMKNDMPSSYA